MFACIPGQAVRSDSLEQAQEKVVLAASQAGAVAEEAQTGQNDILARSSLTAEEAMQHLETVDPGERQNVQAVLNYRFRIWGCTKCRWSQSGCMNCSPATKAQPVAEAGTKAQAATKAQPVAEAGTKAQTATKAQPVAEAGSRHSSGRLGCLYCRNTKTGCSGCNPQKRLTPQTGSSESASVGKRSRQAV